MALRQLPALTKKQWDFVTNKLSEKPTKEQKKRAKEIERRGKIKTYP
jgi:hypothetical protein